MNEYIEKTYKALDLIPNLKNYLKMNYAPHDIMAEISDAFYYHIYENKPVDVYLKENYDFFKNDIFNWIDESDFVEYCKLRFPEIQWNHQIIEQYWISQIGDIKCN